MDHQDQKKWSHHTCLVEYGYCQITRVDFSENYSPVVHDFTFEILILVLIVWPQSKNCGCGNFFFILILKENYFWSVHQEWQMLKRMMSLHWINAYVILYRWQDSIIGRLLKFSLKLDLMVELLTYVCSVNNMKRELSLLLVAIYVDYNLIVGHPDAIKDTIEKLNNFKIWGCQTVRKDLHIFHLCICEFEF